MMVGGVNKVRRLLRRRTHLLAESVVNYLFNAIIGLFAFGTI